MPSQIRTLPKKQRIAEAVKMIKSGATIREAAKKYYVPASTVFYQLGDKAPAARQIFSEEEEKIILDFIEERQKGTPLTKIEFLDLLNEFLKVLLLLK